MTIVVSIESSHIGHDFDNVDKFVEILNDEFIERDIDMVARAEPTGPWDREIQETEGFDAAWDAALARLSRGE